MVVLQNLLLWLSISDSYLDQRYYKETCHRTEPGFVPVAAHPPPLKTVYRIAELSTKPEDGCQSPTVLMELTLKMDCLTIATDVK